MQRPRRDAGLAAQHPRRRGRGREPLDPPFAQQRIHLAQHRRLAAAGMALHPDHQVVRQQHRAHRLLLAPGQPAVGEAFLHRVRAPERPALTLPVPHEGEDLPLRPYRPFGYEGAVHAFPLHLDLLAGRDQPLDRGIDLGERIASRRVAQRDRADFGLRDRRPPLLDMRHRARHRLQHPGLRHRRQLGRPPGRGPALARQLRQFGQCGRAPEAPELVGRQIGRRDLHRLHPLPGRGVDRPVGPQHAPVAREPHLLRASAPLGNQLGEADLLLGLPRMERRHLRVLRVVGEVVFLQIRQDLRPPPRERVHERSVVAGELEPRHPSDHPRRHRHAERLKPPGELVPVIRPRSAFPSAGSWSARRSATRPRRSASCWPARNGCGAAGRRCGSRDAGTPATIMPSAATRGRCRVIGSQPRVCNRSVSIQFNVARTASSCARITRRSPITSASSDTDLGAEKVMSQPGR